MKIWMTLKPANAMMMLDYRCEDKSSNGKTICRLLAVAVLSDNNITVHAYTPECT
jgi:phosphotransferase system HPr-like phosphotransfer protein